MNAVIVLILLPLLAWGDTLLRCTSEDKLEEHKDDILTLLALQQAQLARIEGKLDELLNLWKPCQDESGCSNDNGDQLGDKNYPANSCKEILTECQEKQGKSVVNGPYWIKTPEGAGEAVQAYCDMTRGGWTLVGKVGGSVGNIYDAWLVTNHNVESLKTPRVENNNQYCSIDARPLAVNFASQVMLSSGDNDNGIGSRWIKWDLPKGRDLATFWRHSVGAATVQESSQEAVIVETWNDQTSLCYQNRYGIMPLTQHGGSYPSVTFNTAGNTQVGDTCMAVGVQNKGTQAHGWSQNANGYDSARSDDDWPNGSYNHQAPFLAVWLQ